MRGIKLTVITCQECGKKFETEYLQRKYCLDCVDKVRRAKNNARNVTWRKENPDKCKEYTMRTRQKHPEKKKAWDAKQNKVKRERRKQDPEAEKTNKTYMANYFQENREEAYARNKQWEKDHPEAVKRHRTHKNHNRRALEAQAEGKWNYQDFLALCEASDEHCYYCHKLPGKLTADHMIPITRNGTNWIENIIPACLSCNSSKSTKTLLEFAPIMVRMNSF